MCRLTTLSISKIIISVIGEWEKCWCNNTNRKNPKFPLKTPSRCHISHNQIRQRLPWDWTLTFKMRDRQLTTHEPRHARYILLCVCMCVKERERIKSYNNKPNSNIKIKTRHLTTCGSEHTFLYVNVKENLYIRCLVGQGSLVAELSHTSRSY